jgi:hypothetical protein
MGMPLGFRVPERALGLLARASMLAPLHKISLHVEQTSLLVLTRPRWEDQTQAGLRRGGTAPK